MKAFRYSAGKNENRKIGDRPRFSAKLWTTFYFVFAHAPETPWRTAASYSTW